MDPLEKMPVEGIWLGYAKESIRFEVVEGGYVAYGSELACLRIAYHWGCGTVEHHPDKDYWSITDKE